MSARLFVLETVPDPFFVPFLRLYAPVTAHGYLSSLTEMGLPDARSRTLSFGGVLSSLDVSSRDLPTPPNEAFKLNGLCLASLVSFAP